MTRVRAHARVHVLTPHIHTFRILENITYITRWKVVTPKASIDESGGYCIYCTSPCAGTSRCNLQDIEHF